MTQEEKDLLLKDLCARMPYGVKVKFRVNEVIAIEENITYVIDGEYSYITDGKSYLTLDIIKALFKNWLDEIKPYLFPLSSMPEEQRKELYKIGWYLDEDKIYSCFRNYDDENYKTHTDCFELINWCYENHFDINGLIPRGLAEDATNKNIY